MSDVPHSHLPYGQDGEGCYSDYTLGCHDVIDSTQTKAINCIDEILKMSKPRVFVMVDYGTADGGTSMRLLYNCVKKIKELCGEEQEIQVVYEDQATNDFKSLLLKIHGIMPGDKSYLLDFSRVYVTCSGTSFYKQCLPSESVQFGFAATCMHWLRHRPCNITNGLHQKCFNYKQDKIGKRICYVEQKKWLQLCIDNDGNHLGKTPIIKYSMFNVMNDIVKEMVAEGIITEKEYNNISFGNYYRTVEEYSSPFMNEQSPVYKAGLRLLSIETVITRCPFHKKWMTEGGDAKTHTERYVPTTRTWSNHTFYSGLNSTRSENERRLLVDNIFQRYVNKVETNPSEHGMDYVHAHIVIEKVVA